MAKDFEDGGAFSCLRRLVGLRSIITRDLEGWVSDRKRKVIFAEFVRTRRGKWAYASAEAKAQDPFWRILLRNDFDWFYNRHHSNVEVVVELDDSAIEELVCGLQESTLRKARMIWPKLDVDLLLQAFTDAVMCPEDSLRRLLKNYRVFPRQGHQPRSFTDYFLRTFEWRLMDLLRREKRQRSVGGQPIDYEDYEDLCRYPDESRGEEVDLVPESVTSSGREVPIPRGEAAVYVVAGWSRNSQLESSRCYVRWLARFGVGLRPRIQTYFELSRSGRRAGGMRAKSGLDPVLHEGNLKQLAQCSGLRRQMKPWKDGGVADFIREMARSGEIDVLPSEVDQLLRGWGRFSARRVRDLARRKLEGSSGNPSGSEVFDRGFGRLLAEFKAARKGWTPDQGPLFEYVGQRSGMTIEDVAALDTFVRALSRTYGRHPKFKALIRRVLLEEMDPGGLGDP